MDKLKEVLGPVFAVVMFAWVIIWMVIYIGLLVTAWNAGIGSFIATLIFAPMIIGIAQFIIGMPLVMIGVWIFGDR